MKKHPDSWKVISQPFEDLSEKPLSACSMKATKRKRGKKKAGPPRSTYGGRRDDDWSVPHSYTLEQKVEILGALPVYSDGEVVLQRIQELAGGYLSEVEYEKDKPKPSTPSEGI